MFKMENKLEQERKEVGCNGVNCNYVFQPIDVFESEGVQQIERAVLYCRFCTHTEECIFRTPTVVEMQETENAVQEPRT